MRLIVSASVFLLILHFIFVLIISSIRLRLRLRWRVPVRFFLLRFRCCVVWHLTFYYICTIMLCAMRIYKAFCCRQIPNSSKNFGVELLYILMIFRIVCESHDFRHLHFVICVHVLVLAVKCLALYVFLYRNQLNSTHIYT